MTIASALSALNQDIQDARTAITSKGGTVTVDGGSSQLATDIATIPSGGSFIGIPFEVSQNGVLQSQTTSFEFNVPDVTSISIGTSGLTSSFRGSTGITKFSLPNLTTISQQNSSIGYVCYGCTNLTSVDLSGLQSVTYSSGANYAFYGCTSLTSIDISSLTTISSALGMQSCFSNCSSLTSIDLSGLVSIGGGQAFEGAFMGTGLTEARFTNLQSILSTPVGLIVATMSNCFKNCNLQNLYFNSLTTVSTNNCLSNMLSGVTGCTVHFPASLQATIGSWASVTNGFGGTNTTVLFDLPATA